MRSSITPSSPYSMFRFLNSATPGLGLSRNSVLLFFSGALVSYFLRLLPLIGPEETAVRAWAIACESMEGSLRSVGIGVSREVSVGAAWLATAISL